MYYTLPEITPAIKASGEFRFNKLNDRLNGKFAGPELEARALIEGQFMAKRIHAVKMGLNIGRLNIVIIYLASIGSYRSTKNYKQRNVIFHAYFHH